MLKDDRWQQTLDVDLRAAMKGTALAAQAMIAQNTQGTEQTPQCLACTCPTGLRCLCSIPYLLIAHNTQGAAGHRLQCVADGAASSGHLRHLQLP